MEVNGEVQKTKINGNGRKLEDSKMKNAVKQQNRESKKNQKMKANKNELKKSLCNHTS